MPREGQTGLGRIHGQGFHEQTINKAFIIKYLMCVVG